MTTNDDLDDAASLLYDTGVQILVDVMKSEHLAQSNRLFLSCWGRRLQESSHFIFGQKAAGVLSASDILGLVRLDVEVARTYRERQELSPA